jgi:tRNA nucleotidyltransferase (CCA-adding enzyme)
LPSALLDALRRQPGGEQLLAAAHDGMWLVGGAVRDLLRGEPPRELDVVVEGEVEGLLVALGGEAVVHDRFGTANVTVGGAQIDLARARRERYRQPGALPEVEPAPLAEDLRRRDFTVNAIALALAGERAGEMTAVEHAHEDLAAGRLRVLHERSFIDDPTRLWRLGRYQARLGFEVEERTAQLAAQALAQKALGTVTQDALGTVAQNALGTLAQGAPGTGTVTQNALGTVSRARIGAELRLALGEADPIAALVAVGELGVLAALHPRLSFDAQLAASALELLSAAAGGAEPELRPDLLLLSVLLQPLAANLDVDGVERVEHEMCVLLDGMEFPAPERDRVLRAAICVEAIADDLAHAEAGSEIYEIASFQSLEAIALAGAWDELTMTWGDADVAAYRWLAELRNVRLQIGGDDLLAAGIPEGPEIGRRLEAALCAKLDEELDDGREAELAAALSAR